MTDADELKVDSAKKVRRSTKVRRAYEVKSDLQNNSGEVFFTAQAAT